MNKFKILAIGTDKTILDEKSESYKRQLEYYKDFNLSEILILNSGVTNLNLSNLQKENIKFYFPGGNKITSLVKSVFLLLKISRKNKFDVVYTQDVLYTGILGYLFSRLNGAKLITQLHGDYLDNPLWINQRKENKILNIVGKFLVKKSYKVRCVSNRIVKYVTETLKQKNAVSLPIGIDGTNFNLQNALEFRKKQIIFLGRLIDEKEPILFCEIVIPILEKYPDFTVVVIGAGSLKEEIEKKFSEKKLVDRVIFTGFIGFAEIAKYFKESFVLVKTAFWEGWGMQMVEASACGMPVISTDTGCAGEVIIQNYNGVLIDSNDKSKSKEQIKNEFIVAVEKLIVDKNFYKILCDNASRGSSQWTFETIKQKVQKFITS